ncbi:MAG: sensor histidine kinase [Bacteroidota bacterium]
MFWIILFGILIFIYQAFVGGPKNALIPAFVNLTGLMILAYAHLLYLIPKYFLKKKYYEYGIYVFVILLLTTLYRFGLGWKLVQIFGLDVKEDFTPHLFGALLISGLFFLLITIPFRLVENYFKKQELEQELKTQQLEAELRFLKAQVNPHFLFNALNNIYSLSFTNSSQTPDMILKLSDMMSYMLYDCKTEKVQLSNEIKYLHNYITLQQLKKDGEQKIEFITQGDFTSIQVTPMLFIPFFENVFKHGNLEDTARGWMKSEMKLENRTLHFSIKNSTPQEKKRLKKGGVGLENIRERLQLLYPNRHNLTIEYTENIFKVDLDISFSETPK